MSSIAILNSVLVTMTHVKIGDFLLIAPLLREIAKARTNVTVAIPDILYSTFAIQDYIPRAVRASWIETVTASESFHYVLDLTYPLLGDVQVPKTYRRLSADFFLKPQHATRSYIEALSEHFPEVAFPNEVEPYFDFSPNKDVLKHYDVKPFKYFTVHSGSDFRPKNWDPNKFEESVESIHNQFPELKCIGIVGPCDEPLYMSSDRPYWFSNVSASLETVAHILAGSLFHLDNDSGIHHLAGVLDVPSITVWGPTGPGTWGSISKRNFIHWGGPNCATHCGGAKMITCQDRVCLSSIRPSDLLTSAKKIMAHY